MDSRVPNSGKRGGGIGGGGECGGVQGQRQRSSSSSSGPPLTVVVGGNVHSVNLGGPSDSGQGGQHVGKGHSHLASLVGLGSDGGAVRGLVLQASSGSDGAVSGLASGDGAGQGGSHSDLAGGLGVEAHLHSLEGLAGHSAKGIVLGLVAQGKVQLGGRVEVLGAELSVEAQQEASGGGEDSRHLRGQGVLEQRHVHGAGHLLGGVVQHQVGGNVLGASEAVSGLEGGLDATEHSGKL
jgi:hypothetical protein